MHKTQVRRKWYEEKTFGKSFDSSSYGGKPGSLRRGRQQQYCNIPGRRWRSHYSSRDRGSGRGADRYEMVYLGQGFDALLSAVNRGVWKTESGFEDWDGGSGKLWLPDCTGNSADGFWIRLWYCHHQGCSWLYYPGK